MNSLRFIMDITVLVIQLVLLGVLCYLHNVRKKYERSLWNLLRITSRRIDTLEFLIGLREDSAPPTIPEAGQK